MDRIVEIQLKREIVRTEILTPEIIGQWTPQEIDQLLIAQAHEPARFKYAITPEYDYFLVRVPRAR